MRSTSFVRLWTGLMVLALLVSCAGGCQKIEDFFQKSPVEEFHQESRTITMWGYSQSAVVKAD